MRLVPQWNGVSLQSGLPWRTHLNSLIGWEPLERDWQSRFFWEYAPVLIRGDGKAEPSQLFQSAVERSRAKKSAGLSSRAGSGSSGRPAVKPFKNGSSPKALLFVFLRFLASSSCKVDASQLVEIFENRSRDMVAVVWKSASASQESTWSRVKAYDHSNQIHFVTKLGSDIIPEDFRTIGWE